MIVFVMMMRITTICEVVLLKKIPQKNPGSCVIPRVKMVCSLSGDFSCKHEALSIKTHEGWEPTKEEPQNAGNSGPKQSLISGLLKQAILLEGHH